MASTTLAPAVSTQQTSDDKLMKFIRETLMGRLANLMGRNTRVTATYTMYYTIFYWIGVRKFNESAIYNVRLTTTTNNNEA